MGSSGGSSDYFLRQLSSSDGGSAPAPAPRQPGEWECGTGRRGSRRWSRKKARARGHRRGGGGFCGAPEEAAAAGRKRVMVVVDQSSGAKHAMMWALTHVANRGDFLTLLHVLPRGGGTRGEDAAALANSLGSLCKACKPELHAEPRRGAGGGVHQQGGVPDAGGAAAEQGRRRLPRQHPVAEELLAPRLTLLHSHQEPPWMILPPIERLISDDHCNNDPPVLSPCMFESVRVFFLSFSVCMLVVRVCCHSLVD
ncbi:uncharacterized protein LOC125519144 isoform X1 [Triticum urartu]|uniref:uncharacterized protein LOC125519144 isoform X1 n=1 Tax=Triticum urartu TaxID=4572 RepID=UPI0020439BFC|nr:uncharacterized protein LOC125519144 isoform X1 [Triticum urartu]